MPFVTLKNAEADENDGVILEILPKVDEPAGKPPAGEEMVLARELVWWVLRCLLILAYEPGSGGALVWKWPELFAR